MRSRLILASAFLAAVAVAGAVLFVASDEAPRPAPLSPRSPLSAETNSAESAPPADAGSGRSAAVEPSQPDDRSCLSPEQLETHPAFAKELERLDPVMTNGPAMDSYRYLGRKALLDLADQGDSGAMAVLGAMDLLRFRGLDEARAVAYLRYEDIGLRNRAAQQSPSAAALDDLQTAQDWFYQAALHGRLYALTEMAWLYSWRQQGPVELGWISAKDYDTLDNSGLTAIDPVNVYNDVVHRLAPNLEDGPIGQLLGDMRDAFVRPSARQAAIVDELANQFERDRRVAGLPPVVVPEYRGPALEELQALLCDIYLDGEGVD